MWFQLIFVAVCTLTTFMMLQRKENKRNKPADGSPHPVGSLGTLKSLQVTLSFIVGWSIPNYELLANWSKKSGGLMIINVPKSTPILNIADLTIARRIMNSASWVSRLPDDHYLYSSTFNKPQGLTFGNGNWWKETRKLTMKLLHQLDFFRLENMEQFITFEISQVKSNLDAELKKSDGGEITFNMHHMLTLPTFNIVYQVIMGTRFEHDDPFIKELFQSMEEYSRSFNIGTSVLEVMPWLRKIPGLTYMDSYKKVSQVCYNYFKEVMDSRRKSGTYRTDPQDFADYLLLEIDQRAGKTPCYLTDESFLVCMRDMVLAGSDTTNSALEHGILHVSLRPEIQKRVQAEIDHVIGHSRLPIYADKNKMTYTQAVLLEVLRYASPIPLTSRSPLEDSDMNGIFVPKGSLCGINIYAIHRSTDLWDDPEVFRPERFLNDQSEIVNVDKIIPFGYGKRLCVGETVARITLFIFFVSLMQKYSFQISRNHPPPSLKNTFGLSRYPMPYYVNVRSRSQS